MPKIKMAPEEYKETRLKLGLSQTALAKRLGVSRETVNKRESGTNRITEEAALALAALISQNATVSHG
jgi:DNA-binding XRE family transcriptional regulator